MKKLGYISRYDLNDARAWSGTISNLRCILEQHYDIVPIIVPETGAHTASTKVTRLFSGKKNRLTNFAAASDKKELEKHVKNAIRGVRAVLRTSCQPALSQWRCAG